MNMHEIKNNDPPKNIKFFFNKQSFYHLNLRVRSKSTKELPKIQSNKKPYNMVSDSNIVKIRKLTNLGKAYEVSLDKIDEMQENCKLEKIIPVGKKYKDKALLGNFLDVFTNNYQY